MNATGTGGAGARWLKIAKAFLDCPTAALKEELPARHIAAFVAARPQLSLRQDGAGNLLVKYPADGGSSSAPLVLVAHMDHPGFWIEAPSGRRGEARLLFKGGVQAPFVNTGAKVRFFRTGQKRATGRGELLSFQAENGRLRSAAAKVTSGKAEPGGFAMWDIPAFELRKMRGGGQRIVSRGCDDQLGGAAMLCALDELCRTKPKGAAVWALFTRAEEIGFMGAAEAVRTKLLPKGAQVISLECSRAFRHVPQNGGVAVRLGDRASLFDPVLTDALIRRCEALRAKDPGFRFQHALMNGGICEAAVFCAAGYRASGLALPLGNYHNQAGLEGGRKRIGPEHVAAGDFLAEVRLLVELASHPKELLAKQPAFAKRMKPILRQARRALATRPLSI